MREGKLTDRQSDAEVLEASWGDPACFGEIFTRHYNAVFGFVASAVGPSDGPDLAGEVFARAFAVRRRYDPGYSSARPWLLGISANLIAGYFRARARENRAMLRAGHLLILETDFQDDATNRLDADKVRPLLALAMTQLRIEEAEVVGLFAVAGLSYAEIAEALSIPEGTVRSRLSRARGRLRVLIHNDHGAKLVGRDV